MTEKYLPHFAEGEVVKGFGRGSKQLGIPTANFPDHIVEQLPADLPTGVYYGWARVDDGEIHKMCMSVGWNPYFKNTQKTMETHIMHNFKDDFYGSKLKVIMLGFIRPMTTFGSLDVSTSHGKHDKGDSLIEAIQNDIAESHRLLDEPSQQQHKLNNFFNIS